MGIGFAVARFGLFLREMQDRQVSGAPHGTGASLWSGVALVLLGVAVELASIFRHVRMVRQLSTGTWQPGKVSVGAVGLAGVLGAIGIGIAAYLIVR